MFPQGWWDGVDQERFRCGHLVTWENYDSQTDTIQLAVVIALFNDPSQPNPVIWLAGGPGASGFFTPAKELEYANGWGRDFIQFSQRGSHLSQSAMYCPQVRQAVIKNWGTPDGEKPPNWEQWVSASYEALERCYGTLGQANGWDYLSNINSKFNALDVIYLMRVLRDNFGYRYIELFGGSYGSLLAQHIIVLSPGDVHSVVLDAVAPLGVDWIAEYPRNLHHSLQLIFDACRTSSKCAETYPELDHTFLSRLLNQLKTEPLCIKSEIEGAANSNLCLDDYGYLLALGNLLSTSENLPKIPRIIYGSWYRDVDRITELGTSYYSSERDESLSWGMYYSIYCNEFARFDPDNIDLGQVEQQFQTLYTASKQLINKVCYLYDQNGRAYGSTSIQSKVHVLVFNGKFDPLTPVEYGNRVADALELGQGFRFTSETMAHGSSDSYCGNEIIRNFFNDPEALPDRGPTWWDRSPCWNEQSETIDFELVTFNPDTELPPGSELPSLPELPQINPDTFNTWLERIRTWWEKQQKSMEEGIDKWWQEQQKKIEDGLDQWWQDFQKQLADWLWQQYINLLNQCLGTALLPAGALACVWMYRRKNGKRSNANLD